MCCRVPLPGTLVRMPSAFGEFLVSQTLTVAQNGRSSPAQHRFECAEAVVRASRGALARVHRELRVLGHDDARRELRSGIRTRRQPQTGRGGRSRKEGCGTGDQDRGGGKSWHYAWYIGPTWASLERGRLEFVMNSRLARS